MPKSLKYCLSKDELYQVVNWEIFGDDLDLEIDVEELRALVDQSSLHWDREIICLNSFLSIVLERVIKAGKDPNIFLKNVYENLPSKMYFNYVELNQNELSNLINNFEPTHTRKVWEEITIARSNKDDKRLEQLMEEFNYALEDELIYVFSR